MNDTHYAEGITAQNLRIFLELWAQIMPGIEDTMQTIIDINDLLFDEEDDAFSWCHLYELPTKDHVNFNFPGLLQEDQIIDWRKQVAESLGKITALPNVAEQINEYFDARDDPPKRIFKLCVPFCPIFALIFILYSIPYFVFYTMDVS